MVFWNPFLREIQIELWWNLPRMDSAHSKSSSILLFPTARTGFLQQKSFHVSTCTRASSSVVGTFFWPSLGPSARPRSDFLALDQGQRQEHHLAAVRLGYHVFMTGSTVLFWRIRVLSVHSKFSFMSFMAPNKSSHPKNREIAMLLFLSRHANGRPRGKPDDGWPGTVSATLTSCRWVGLQCPLQRSTGMSWDVAWGLINICSFFSHSKHLMETYHRTFIHSCVDMSPHILTERLHRIWVQGS